MVAAPRFRVPALRLATAFAVALASAPCGATVLYKSIAANGVVQFSDIPPDSGTIVEQRELADPSSPQPSMRPVEALAALDAAPLDDPGYDAEIARANTQVDLAEHALALARGGGSSAREAMQLKEAPRTLSDAQRIAFYERNLYTARRTLLQALNRRWAMR